MLEAQKSLFLVAIIFNKKFFFIKVLGIMDIKESLTVELDADGYALLYKVKL